MIDDNIEIVMISESDWNEMNTDIEYYHSLSEMLSALLEEAGIEVSISEEDVWNYIRENGS